MFPNPRFNRNLLLGSPEEIRHAFVWQRDEGLKIKMEKPKSLSEREKTGVP